MKKFLFLLIMAVLGFSHTIFALEKFDESELRCGIENCHGLDIICGQNIPEVCTEMYGFGDRCRQYVRCEVVDGKCMLVEGVVFEKCKLCVQKCQEILKEDVIEGFQCEAKCGE